MRSLLRRTAIPLLMASIVASPSRPLIAAPPRSLSLTAPADPLLPVSPPAPRAAPPESAYQPAPLPNRDVDSPLAPKASNEPSVAPSLFTRGDTYRGEGFNNGSTAASEQEKRARPAPGFNLRMPLTGK